MTLFAPSPVTDSESAEAKRLSWLALGCWAGGWVAPYVLGMMSITGSGELGLPAGLAVIVFTLITGILSTIFGLRFAFRAYSIDGSLILPKVVLFLYLVIAGIIGFWILLFASI